MSRRFASHKGTSYGSVCAIGLGLIATGCLAVAAHGSTVATATLGPPVTNEIPLGYRIDLTIDSAEPRFTGHVEIDFKLKDHSRLIHLDAGDRVIVPAAEFKTGSL